MHNTLCSLAASRTGRALLVSVLLAGCDVEAPPCPYADEGKIAPSAGCFITFNQGLLVVQNFNRKLGLPGGSSEPEEGSRCTAYRETWEETGLLVEPTDVLTVFDTGFYLYRCSIIDGRQQPDPPPRMEVLDAFYLPADQFDEYRWRFDGQKDLLRVMLLESD
ncbi:MAG: NUDIX hydrolase [Pseudomonadota bacterium]